MNRILNNVSVKSPAKELLREHKSLRRVWNQGSVTEQQLETFADIALALSEIEQGGNNIVTASIVRFEFWVSSLSQARIPVGPSLDFIADKKSFAMIDRLRCRRKGWARQQILIAASFHPKTRIGSNHKIGKYLPTSSNRGIFHTRQVQLQHIKNKVFKEADHGRTAIRINASR